MSRSVVSTETDRERESSLDIDFFSSRRRHTRFKCDWSSDVCSSDLTHTNTHAHTPTHTNTHQGVLDTYPTHTHTHTHKHMCSHTYTNTCAPTHTNPTLILPTG